MMPWFLGNSNGMNWDWSLGWQISLVPLMIWSMAWSGLALWHAAKRGEKWWFVLFLLVHTVGVLEIFYLVFVVKLFANAKPHHKKKRS